MAMCTLFAATGVNHLLDSPLLGLCIITQDRLCIVDKVHWCLVRQRHSSGHGDTNESIAIEAAWPRAWQGGGLDNGEV